MVVDGDDTYDARVAPALVSPAWVDDNLDMVVGRRVEPPGAYRAGHRLATACCTGLVRRNVRAQIDDMLSGSGFSRAGSSEFPSFSREFEIETELTVHAMQMRMAVAEIDTDYRSAAGLGSKLRPFRDGWRSCSLSPT